MTTRTQPAAKRPSRSGRDAHDNRKNLLINLGFALVIVIGLIALIAAAVSTYAGQHFTEIAKVNDQSISQDTYRDAFLVDTFRLNQAEAQVNDRLQLGRIGKADHESQVNAIVEARKGLANVTLERLIDGALEGQLAKSMGIVVTDAQIDEGLVEDATRAEERHIGTITVEPEVSTGAAGPTDAQKSAAQAKAAGALADLKAGKAFEEVAKAVSTDGNAGTGGDAGWVRRKDTSADAALLTAIFGLAQPGLTDVVVGADGAYRIGRLVEIAPQTVDPTWVDRIKNAGVPLGAYRDMVRAGLIREALTKRVVADNTTVATPQRKVSEIFIASPADQKPGDEVKVRHILYAPDQPAAGASPLASGDPSWTAAKVKAQATFDKLKVLKGQPDQLLAEFEKIAKADSTDTGSGANGGELGWYTREALVAPFADAIFADGLKKGDLLGPIQTEYGWHVIQFEGRRPPPDARLAAVQAQAAAPGADFAALAKANSDGPEAATGGDIGWIARFQVDPAREKSIFAAPVGKVSDVFKTDGGSSIFLVGEEATRLPDGQQLETLKADVFRLWFDAEKAKATITPDLSTPTQ